MTTDEQIREVYAHFGLAVYHGQVLEHGIVNAMLVLWLPDRHRFTRRDVDSFMDQQFENTLGKLIKNLRSEITFPPDLEELLNKALKTRNWLCHDYFRERAEDFMTERGRTRMLAELADARAVLAQADDRLSAVVQPIADRCGLTEGKVQAEFRALCQRNGITTS